MIDFFVDGEFYSDLDELMDAWGVYSPEDLEDAEEGLGVLEDEWSVVAYEASTAPFYVLKLDELVEYITETIIVDFPDDRDDITYNRTVEALRAGIDVDKINNLMPNVWQPTKNKFIITKQDLINYIG